jgi:hypothetical protein
MINELILCMPKFYFSLANGIRQAIKTRLFLLEKLSADGCKQLGEKIERIGF